MFYKLIFKIGQRLRNPSLGTSYRFLKKSEKWTLEDLKAYQLLKLKELVSLAYNNSKYYKNEFDKIGLKPVDIKTLNDIKRIPILTKSKLLKNISEIHTNLKFNRTRVAKTSGTTGNSLMFKREEEAESFNRAVIFRGYSWYKVKPWDRNGYFWGFNFNNKERIKTKILDWFQNRFRSFSYIEKDVKHFLHKLQSAKYLHGYSSMIYQLAKKINTQNYKRPKKLKLIKGTSEKVFDSYQEQIKNAFGIKMVNEYGATESGIIAFECPQGNMHINMEGVIVEVENEEIIVTNLQLQSFPIIRYKLGDYIKLAPNHVRCSCGMNHLIIKEVTGRVGEKIYGFHNFYPSLYFYYIFKNISIKYELELTYKVVQHEIGKLIFYIEQKLNDKDRSILEKEIKVYFKEDIEFLIKDSQELFSISEKSSSFISNIDI